MKIRLGLVLKILRAFGAANHGTTQPDTSA